MHVTSGVPQGMAFGLLLFFIFVNYITAGLTCSFMVFADDLKLYLSLPRSTSETLPVQMLQSNIDYLVKTSSSWGLQVNHSKCAVMRFSHKICRSPHEGISPYKANGHFTNFVESYTDLGVSIGRNLRFRSHIASKVAKISGLSINLLSSTLSRNPQLMVNVYTMHLESLIEYGSALWNVEFVDDMRLLEKVQRRWTKSIACSDTKSYRERLALLDLFSVRGRLLRAGMIFVWRILQGKCAVQHLPIKFLSFNLHAALEATQRSCIYQTPKFIAVGDFL